MEEYKIYDLNEGTINLFKASFDINGSPKNLENIRWQFFKNPTKKYLVDIAFDTISGKVAGIYAVSCISFKINTQISVGSQSLDTITDIDFRGKGLFTKLAKSVYQKAENTNISLVYGFPNGNSIHGFEKKLEWVVLDPVPFLIKPLKSRYFTNKISFLKFFPNINLSFKGFSKSKEYTIKEEFSFPDEVNNLWDNFSKDIKVAVNRNKEYLHWRYIKKPNEDYKVVHCYDSYNKFLGFIVYCVKDKHDGRVAYIMELIYDLKHPKAGCQLLSYAVKEVKKENADLILTWCFQHSPNYNALKKSFFFKLPEKIRPIELHFGAMAFDCKLKNIISKRENWYLSYSDSDTV